VPALLPGGAIGTRNPISVGFFGSAMEYTRTPPLKNVPMTV
jgi:hypothetical protein